MEDEWNDAIALLVEAAQSGVHADPATPWNYGWSLEEYRSTSDAALGSGDAAFHLAPSGQDSLELGMARLLAIGELRQRWDERELWEFIAHVLAEAAAAGASPASMINARVSQLRKGVPTLVVVVVGNLAWRRRVVELPAAVLGVLDEEFVLQVSATSAGRHDMSSNSAMEWFQQHSERRYEADDEKHSPVALAAWVDAYGSKAFRFVAEYLDDLVALTLIFTKDPGAHGVYSLRGDSHRPGVRGLVIDRGAVRAALSRVEATNELYSESLEVSSLGVRNAGRWFGEPPFPLDALHGDVEVNSHVRAVLRGDGPVPDRVRIAARWFAKAHWSLAPEDAILALGIALDALVGGRQGLPGRALADRFALLEPNPRNRRDRAKRHASIYAARSAVAHGGKSSKTDVNFVRSVASDVTWAAYRLVALTRQFGPHDEVAFEALFDDLRWGNVHWDDDSSSPPTET